jgi:Mn-dependent DtxR family transcriptional regulator
MAKKVKSGSSTSKIENKLKTNKLDNSVNYGRITLTKSIEKNSGR